MIELMVASILLGMLVAILTMIFNQSSIAWRTGVTTVSDLGDMRAESGTYHEICDDLLPGLDDSGDSDAIRHRMRASLFGDNGGLAERAVEQTSASPIDGDKAKKGESVPLNRAGAGTGSALFTVGVRSAGPDRTFDTPDDLTTMPEDIE